MADNTPSLPVVSQPTPEAKQAIEEFLHTGAWPKPGTMPVRIRLGGYYE